MSQMLLFTLPALMTRNIPEELWYLSTNEYGHESAQWKYPLYTFYDNHHTWSRWYLILNNLFETKPFRWFTDDRVNEWIARWHDWERDCIDLRKKERMFDYEARKIYNVPYLKTKNNKEELDKDRIRQSIRMSELVGQHTKLRMRGTKGMGCCPFHKERKPSFSVDDEKGVWNCFSCGEGGDVFSYIMKRYELDFYEALKFADQLIV